MSENTSRPAEELGADPVLPGEPIPGAEEVYKHPPELPSNEDERGDKLP
jgi:hypothetical protein